MSRAQKSPKGVGRVERSGALELTVPMPTTRYVDQFLRLRCREELADNELFPNTKELTESFAAADAVLHKVGLSPGDQGVVAVVVGDGSTPRTAATVALRSTWRVLSVDPALRLDLVRKWPRPIRRLELRASKVESLSEQLPGRCVLVAVHAHVRLDRAIRSVERCGGDVVGAVALPCCGYTHEARGLSLVADYEDWGIWSPERRVVVWAR